MILSHKNKFIFLLPWKTASQTAILRISQYDESPYSKFFHFNESIKRVIHQHLTYADLLSLPEGNLEYFTASFVRNPYDRAYSGFIQLQHDITHQRGAQFESSWIKNIVFSQLEENERQLIESEYDFDLWIKSVRPDQVFETGRNTNFPLHPACYWTHGHSNKKVDFVGLVESFEEDFSKFCKLVNIENKPNHDFNVRYKDDNSAHNQYGYRYVDRMSAASIDKINDLFSDDFRIFGYEKILP